MKKRSSILTLLLFSSLFLGLTACNPQSGFTQVTALSDVAEDSRGHSDLPNSPESPMNSDPQKDPAPSAQAEVPEQAKEKEGKAEKPLPSMNPEIPAMNSENAVVAKYGCSDSSDDDAVNDKKILLCHIPSGKKSKGVTICIGVSGAVNGHGLDLNTCKSDKGDYCGACQPCDHE